MSGQRWEYQIVSNEKYAELIKELNVLGLQGWEAVGTFVEIRTGFGGTRSTDTVVLLKRQISN